MIEPTHWIRESHRTIEITRAGDLDVRGRRLRLIKHPDVWLDPQTAWADTVRPT